MRVRIIETVVNVEAGLESVIMMGGNGEHNYRVVNRDTDANETFNMIFTHTYAQAKRYAKQFCFGLASKLEKVEAV